MKKALLLSGGIESAILAYEFKPNIAFSIDYGQSSSKSEIKSAKYICKKLNIKHIVLNYNINVDDIKSDFSSLNISSEWIPFRNHFIIMLAVMESVKHDINEIQIGIIKTDDVHPDGTKEFMDNMNSLLSFDHYKINITAPYINYSSEELANITNIPLGLISIVHSCTSSNIPCGKCNSCIKYYEFFKIYKSRKE